MVFLKIAENSKNSIPSFLCGFEVLKGKVLLVIFCSRGDPPCCMAADHGFHGEFPEWSEILPDLEFSDRCCIEVSRVLFETVSSQRNLRSKLKTWWGMWDFDCHL